MEVDEHWLATRLNVKIIRCEITLGFLSADCQDAVQRLLSINLLAVIMGLLTHVLPQQWANVNTSAPTHMRVRTGSINMKDFMLIFCLILPQKSFKHPYFTVLSANFQESGRVKETQFKLYFTGWCHFYHHLYIENLQFKYSDDCWWLS